MRPMRLASISAFFAAFVFLGIASAEDVAVVQKKLVEQFALTKTTADRSDIVTAGSVLVLHKDGLVMFSTGTSAPPLSIYKDGKLQRNDFKDKFKVLWNRGKAGNTDNSDVNSIPHRTFVAGEKFWVTAITMQQDGAIFDVYSDPFNDVRYYGQLKFPYPKNSPPTADDLLKTVQEVVTVQSDDSQKADSGGKKGGGQAPGQSAPSSAALAPIAPPPPPADQPPAPPKTIKVGQSKEEVLATWGQPTRTVKLASKEIDYYPDMKVTFIAGKVSDVE